MNERTLCHIWNGLRFRREQLLDVNGQPLQLVYRGRWQAGPGPDFRGAIIARGDGRLLHGDVEIHLRTADWVNHRHERDPLFNSVVLHVVLHHDRHSGSHRQDGAVVPVLELSDYLLDEPPTADGIVSLWEGEPCRRLLLRWSDEQVGALLDQAGDQRLRQHAAGCEGDMAVLGTDETVYRRLFDALGYGQNRGAMRELACRLPLADLASAARRLPAEQRQPALARVLLGTAGLDGDGAGWQSLLAPGSAPSPLSRERWRLAGLRPANSPLRRLHGAAALLAASTAAGLAQHICLDFPAGPPAAAARELRRRLMVPDPAPGPRPRHLVGAGRAADVVVNVVLPCAIAYADLASHPGLAAAAWAVYHAHPKLGENELTRLMANQLLGTTRRRLVLGARRQQGLLYLFRGYCDLKSCGVCPAGGASD